MQPPTDVVPFADFFTATCLEWKPLLQLDKYKDVITESLRFLITNNRAKVYAFVIMPNHLHLIWQMQAEHKRAAVQQDFLKFTAQQINEDLKRHHPQVLEPFRVNARDRTYQFWERNPLSVPLWRDKVAVQKLNYIHQSPVRARLCPVRWSGYIHQCCFIIRERGGTFYPGCKKRQGQRCWCAIRTKTNARNTNNSVTNNKLYRVVEY